MVDDLSQYKGRVNSWD